MTAPLADPTDGAAQTLSALFGQQRRLARIRFPEHASHQGRPLTEVFLVENIDGREAVSECSRYQVDLLADDTHIELKTLLGQPVTLELLTDQSHAAPTGAHWAESDTAWHRCGGFIEQAELIGSDGGYARYRLSVASHLQLAAWQHQQRYFIDRGVPEIIEILLQELPGSLSVRGGCGNLPQRAGSSL